MILSVQINLKVLDDFLKNKVLLLELRSLGFHSCDLILLDLILDTLGFLQLENGHDHGSQHILPKDLMVHGSHRQGSLARNLMIEPEQQPANRSTDGTNPWAAAGDLQPSSRVN